MQGVRPFFKEIEGIGSISTLWWEHIIYFQKKQLQQRLDKKDYKELKSRSTIQKVLSGWGGELAGEFQSNKQRCSLGGDRCLFEVIWGKAGLQFGGWGSKRSRIERAEDWRGEHILAIKIYKKFLELGKRTVSILKCGKSKLIEF